MIFINEECLLLSTYLVITVSNATSFLEVKKYLFTKINLFRYLKIINLIEKLIGYYVYYYIYII